MSLPKLAFRATPRLVACLKGLIRSGMVFAQVMGYVNTVLALRFIDVTVYGTVIFLITFLHVLTSLSKQGMQVAAIKFIPEYIGRGDPQSARSIFVDSKWLILIGGVILSAFSPVIYGILPETISDQVSFPLFLFLFLPLIFFSPLLIVNTFGFMGLKSPFWGSFTGYLLRPVVRLVCFLSILALLPTVSGLIYAEIIPFIIVYLLSEWILSRKGLGLRLPTFNNTSRLYRFALPMVGTELLGLGIYEADKIFLGYMMAPESVGIYTVANRIAFLVIAPFWAGATVIGPLFSEYWSKNQVRDLDEIYKYFTSLFLFIVGVAALFIFINIRFLLGLFGPDFVTDETIAVSLILSFTLFLTILPGHYAQFTLMSGRTHLVTLITFGTALLNVVLNYFLIQRYGILGAAGATAIALGSASVIGFLVLNFVYKRAVWPFCTNYFVALLPVLALAAVFYVFKNPYVNNLLTVMVMAVVGYRLFNKELLQLLGKLRS